MDRMMWTAMMVAAPVLVVSLVVGLIVSVLQVATQLQEATLSYVPKLVAAALVIVAAGPWMLHQITAFARYAITVIPSLDLGGRVGSDLASWVASSLLLSLRVAPVFAMAPPFSLTQTPAIFRMLFGLGMAAAIAGGLPETARHLDLSPGALTLAAAHELLIGAVFVMAFQLAYGAIYVAGRIVDIQAGFGLALLIDPTSQAQTPLIGTFFAYAAAVVFFSLDGHADLLRIFAASLHAAPLGAFPVALSAARAGSYAGMVFLTALGVTGGAILVLFLTDVAIAFLSRTVPQMNVLILGLQVKTMVVMLILPVSFAMAGVLLARLARITLEGAPSLI